MKRVVVTGAGRGLGAAISDVLAGHGWEVWATDQEKPAPASSAAARMLQMDVRDPAAVAEVFRLADAEGGVDAVVNNAGIYPLAAWNDHDSALMHAVFDVNVVGAMHCAQAAAEIMIRRRDGGSILNVVSLAFHKGVPNAMAYGASKGALIGLTRSLASSLGQHGIRVNALAPGLMATPGTAASVETGGLRADRLIGDDEARVLRGRTEPPAVAELVGVLIGPAARDMTGQVVIADGGTHFG